MFRLATVAFVLYSGLRYKMKINRIARDGWDDFIYSVSNRGGYPEDSEVIAEETEDP